MVAIEAAKRIIPAVIMAVKLIEEAKKDDGEVDEKEWMEIIQRVIFSAVK